jgi:hypothetical protein
MYTPVLYTGDDFPDLIARFQMALYRHHNGTESNSTLYDPSIMKMFADQHAPGLFNKILQLMENNRPISEKRQMKNRQRTVALLHILSYFRQGGLLNIQTQYQYLT